MQSFPRAMHDEFSHQARSDRVRSARFGVLLASGFLACAGAGGCAQAGHLSPPPSQAQLAGDRYALAHGMALAFLTSGRATGMDLLQVIHLDRAALLALAGGDVSNAPSDALLDYVTRREIDGAPAPNTVPKEFVTKLPQAAPPTPTAPAPRAAAPGS